MPHLTMALLGGFRADLGSGQPLVLPKKTRALLAYLAFRQGHGASRDHLAALLWGDTRDEQARKSLRQTVYVLRKALGAAGAPSLFVEGEMLTLNPDGVDVDVGRFEQLTAENTPGALEAAAALYRGDLLEGFSVDEPPFEDWRIVERERLRELALEMLARLLSEQIKSGQNERAIRTGMRLLALDASQEAVHRTLMRLYAAQGRRGAALKQYQLCVAALHHDLGMAAEPETKRLYRDIVERRVFDSPMTNASAAAISATALESTTHGAPANDVSATLASAALRPEPFAREAVSTRRTALIGRVGEIAELRAALDRAWQGHGSVIAIAGEAGIGKTALLEAFTIEAQARGTRILFGRSYPTEQMLTFGPWVEALRAGRAVADPDVLSALGTIGRLELARLFPEIGGPEGDGRRPVEHRRLFDSVARLVSTLAMRAPVLIVLDDVHWADTFSLRLMAFLARRIETARVIIAVAMRDDEMATAAVLHQVLDELARERHFVRLALGPLSRADATALVCALRSGEASDGNTANVEARASRASEGNPFVMVEIVRAAHETSEPGARETLSVPERVRRLVSERLARLGDRERHLVAVAAVIGREFEFTLLQRASTLDERNAAEGVEELVHRRVLRAAGDQFAFTHDWIRDVAYDRLLQPTRNLLHLRVTEALEGLHARYPPPPVALRPALRV